MALTSPTGGGEPPPQPQPPPPPTTTTNHEAESPEAKKGWHRWRGLFSKEDEKRSASESAKGDAADEPKPAASRRFAKKKVIPGIPRPGTFKRQNSERRERLEKVPSAAEEKRALSVDRKKFKGRPPLDPTVAVPCLSPLKTCFSEGDDAGRDATIATATESLDPLSSTDDTRETRESSVASPTNLPTGLHSPVSEPAIPSRLDFGNDFRPLPPLSPPPEAPNGLESPIHSIGEEALRAEHEDRWILNLSMHFRDRSPREKFFITYAETPVKWRRVTVSVDYRNAPPDSLERDLQGLTYQRDKSFRIYEAIRASLADIQWYDTVTNLRLETSDDDRLHVHVTEDVNEIIEYPSIRLLNHIDIPRIPERDVEFESHMSGFVYKVRVQEKTLIKKEIPGPDSVEEFLYEINALYSLNGSSNVVPFAGLVVDEEEGLIKGILIAYAEQGPLVDLIYDFRGHLSWERREKWAWEIVNGLSQIHEGGFVQGDFTLSNIVVDDNDSAMIIDINRRGCPVGWEPPEIARMIQSGQRISMYIGVKSDLYQLGMVLWALAQQIDEPERQDRPLTLEAAPSDVPQYFKDIVETCLNEQPRNRQSAKELLKRFPEMDPERLSKTPLRHLLQPPEKTPLAEFTSANGHAVRSDSRSRSRSRGSSRSRGFSDFHTYIEGRPSSIEMPFDGPSSFVVPHRGRSPPVNTAHVRSGSFDRGDDPGGTTAEPQVVSVSPTQEHKWEEMFDEQGNSFLVEADEDPEEHERRIQRSFERMRHPSLANAIPKEPLTHTDSGLGDIDSPFSRTPTGFSFNRAATGFSSLGRAATGLSLSSGRAGGMHSGNSPGKHMQHTDSGLADMDLMGVGENEMLKNYDSKEVELDLGEPGPDLVTLDEDQAVHDFDTDSPKRLGDGPRGGGLDGKPSEAVSHSAATEMETTTA